MLGVALLHVADLTKEQPPSPWSTERTEGEMACHTYFLTLASSSVWGCSIVARCRCHRGAATKSMEHGTD